MEKKQQTKHIEIPAKQGKSQVGYKKPPKEHQFKPGQSGNPSGPPKRRTQLWVYFTEYMAMTDTELAGLNRCELSQAQQTALRLVENAKAGKHSGSERLAYHIFDREEGKAKQKVKIEGEVPGRREISAEELREMMQEKPVDCEDVIAR